MKKLILFLIVATMILTCVPCSADWHGDLDDLPSEWAKESMREASKYGIVKGEGIQSAYTDKITRGEFASLIIPLVEEMRGEITPAPAGTFSDTDSVYVLKAYAAGIVNGTGNGKFSPDALITRQEIAVMFCRAIGYVESSIALWIIGAHPELIVDHTAAIQKHDDYNQVASWAQKQVALLYKHGIMVGTGSKTLAPRSNATVQEAIILTMRVARDVFKMD